MFELQVPGPANRCSSFEFAFAADATERRPVHRRDAVAVEHEHLQQVRVEHRPEPAQYGVDARRDDDDIGAGGDPVLDRPSGRRNRRPTGEVLELHRLVHTPVARQGSWVETDIHEALHVRAPAQHEHSRTAAEHEEAAGFEDEVKVRGAWFRDGTTRMDDQQHALSALLLTMPIVGAVPSRSNDSSRTTAGSASSQSP